MPKKPKKHRKESSGSKPVKIEGSFDDLIRKMVSTKKPAGGWAKK
jgi:hypothetical protein